MTTNSGITSISCANFCLDCDQAEASAVLVFANAWRRATQHSHHDHQLRNLLRRLRSDPTRNPSITSISCPKCDWAVALVNSSNVRAVPDFAILALRLGYSTRASQASAARVLCKGLAKEGVSVTIQTVWRQATQLGHYKLQASAPLVLCKALAMCGSTRASSAPVAPDFACTVIGPPSPRIKSIG